MKKIFALTIVITVLMTTVFCIIPGSAETTSTTVSNDVLLYQNRLKALGVIGGEIDLEEEVTRAELTSFVGGMFYSDDSSYVDRGQIFSDVPTDHPYYAEITKAYMTGTIKGNGDGTFSPDDKITYGDASKIFLCLTGYEVVANEKGGYPLGYWTLAGQKGILPYGAQIDNFVIMSDLIYMTYKTLDLPVMETSYYGENSGSSVNNDHTLLGDLMKNKEIEFQRGIMTSDGITYLDGPSTKEKNIISVDGIEYRCEDLDTSQFIGQNIEFWYTTGTKYQNVYNLYPYYDKNNIDVFDVDDIEYIDLNNVKINSNTQQITKKFSTQLMVVYNGQGLDTFSAEDLNVKNGRIELIDNNGDRAVDVLFLYEKDSYAVDSVGSNGYSIKYKMYEGQNESGLHIDEEDDNIAYIARTSDGTKISPENISSDCAISVYKSKTEDVITVVVSKDIVTGTVDVVRENNRYVTVMGTEYEVAKNSKGEILNLDFKLGTVLGLYLDEYGRVVYATTAGDSSTIYAYIIDMDSFGGFSDDNWKIKVAIAGNLSSISNAQYYWVRDKLVQNESIKVFELSSKVLLDEFKYKGNEFSQKLNEYRNEVVILELNSSGQVSTITKMIPIFEYTEGNYNHNTQSLAQPDLVVNEYDNPAITLNGSVKGLVIPDKNDSERDNYTDEQYLSKYRIENGRKTHKLMVYELVENSQTPKLIAMKEKLTDSGTAQAGADRGILYSAISEGIDEAGGKVYYADYLDQNGNLTNTRIRGDVSADRLWSMKTNIKDLRVGDIVEFSKDSEGDVMSFKVISSASEPIESNLVKLGKVIKYDDSAVWNENNEGYRNIFYFISSDGTKWVQGISVDNAIFKYDKSRKSVEKISGGEISPDINLTYADTVMIASDIAVIIAE